MAGIPAREQPQERPMNDIAPVRSGIDFKAEAHRDPWSVPLHEIDVSNPYLYSEDTWHGFFARLRREAPVHFVDSPLYGPYWSVTRYRDIMTVDTSHQTYSSDAAFGGITLKDVSLEYRKESFIAMDPPRHDEQRRIVAPIVAPPNLAKMSGTIRERAIRILEGLPRDEVFDWVDRVSIELTTQTLSTLFDFPFEERRTLTRWSNVSTVNTRAGTEIDSEEKRDAVLQEMLAYFAEVWKIRQKQPPK
jgi:cytochrome P450